MSRPINLFVFFTQSSRAGEISIKFHESAELRLNKLKQRVEVQMSY